MTAITGWITVALIVFAALFPVGYRLRAKKRAAPDAPSTKLHVAVGVGVVGLAFLHTLAILPDLGSPAAVASGMLGFLPGGLAFFLLITHAGLGLQLRKPKLRARAKKRRAHVITATAITLAVTLHVVLLRSS